MIKTLCTNFATSIRNSPRYLSTGLILNQDDNKSLKTVQTDLEEVKDESKTVEKLKQPTALNKYEIPDEDPAIPKELVFQKLTKTRLESGCYSLEEARRYAPSIHQFKYYKYPSLLHNLGNLEYVLRSNENEYSLVMQFPDMTDHIVVGSGLIGSATAYYMKQIYNRQSDVCVIDKDPYGTNSCTAISNGLISAQSKSEEVVRVAQTSKELIRCLKNDVVCTNDDFAKINYKPVTHLVLYTEEQGEEVVESVNMQLKNNCFVEAKLPDQLKLRFSFLEFEDVAVGTHGNQDEALVDPIALRNLYRTLAQAHGANFIKAEAIDFNMIYKRHGKEIDRLATSAMVVKIDSGELRNVLYASAVLCLGHNTPYLESQAEMEDYYRDAYDDMHFLQPKLRLIFTFNSMTTPVIDFPVITEADGSQLICEDFAGNFKYYLNLEDCEEMFDEDCDRFMDVDSEEPYPNLFHKGEKFELYFENVIKPKLVKRAPSMEDARFLFAQSGFENWNLHDGSPIMSEHPYFYSHVMAGGFGNRMMNFAPLAGMALAELSREEKIRLLDVYPFYWDRVFKGGCIADFPQILGGFKQL